MVSNIPTSRVPGNEHASEIGHVSQPPIPLLPSHGLRLQPPDGSEAVVNGSREPVLRREPIVGRNDDGSKLESEAEAVVLAVGPGARADAEAAAVDVEEDRELLGGRGGVGRLVEAEAEVVDRVENDVFPGHGAVVVHRDVEARLRRATNGAVAVYAEDASAFVDFVGSGTGGGGRHGSLTGTQIKWVLLIVRERRMIHTRIYG